MQKFLKLNFERFTNSLKRKRLPQIIFRNNIQLKNKIKANFNILALILLFFYSVFGYGQSKIADSVWTSIYKIEPGKELYQAKETNYNDLFYRYIHVPLYNKVNKKDSLIPIAQSIESILKQTQLNKSYSLAEIKGTELEKSLIEIEKLSFPFSSYLTPKLAAKVNLLSNMPILVSKEEQLYQLVKTDSTVFSTKKMLSILHENTDFEIDKKGYLRFRLLNFIIGSYNTKPEDYVWKVDVNQKIVPYINTYQNEYMNFDGSYKLISKLITSFKHFEPYTNRIENLKKVSAPYVGFDTNILSVLPYAQWKIEISEIQNLLTITAIKEIRKTLPKGILESDVTALFSVLNERIKNLDEIANSYYNLISENKIVLANNENNIIEIKRKLDTTIIYIYSAKNTKKIPIQIHTFSEEDTKEIWVYGLKGNDYFEVSGKSNSYIPIKLIGGGNSDKYEIQNGKKVTVYDNKQQTFIVSSDKANLNFSNEKFITTYHNNKYKHKTNLLKPRFGANPDDGLFIGAVNEYKTLGFDQNPFSSLHSLSANLYLGTLGLKIDYYTEKANLYKGFNAFGGLGFQSSNYSTNFFGFGNETIYDVNQKQDYNRIRMSTIDAKIGVLKKTQKYNFSTNLFFESIKIDNTPNRFVSSETLFFPSDDFFDRKNYVGLSVNYVYKNNIINNLQINPQINIATTVDIQDFNKTNVSLQPKLFLSHPMYANKITLDATISYQHVFGTEIPFYQAANLGGSTGLRGYRNQRFTGQSLCYISSNIKWHIKDVKSDILPIKFGVLGGFDVGRVWQENEVSSQFHTDFGAGIWLQTAELIKAKLQGFKGSEDFRFEINVSIGF